MLALVGVSGSGKSTLFSLVEQFYNPTSGSVSLDGIGYQYLNIRWLRSKIGVVSQEPVLFDMSIAENIRYGANDREVTDLDVELAAKAANIHDFITALPKVSGYNLHVQVVRPSLPLRMCTCITKKGCVFRTGRVYTVESRNYAPSRQ